MVHHAPRPLLPDEEVGGRQLATGYDLGAQYPGRLARDVGGRPLATDLRRRAALEQDPPPASYYRLPSEQRLPAGVQARDRRLARPERIHGFGVTLLEGGVERGVRLQHLALGGCHPPILRPRCRRVAKGTPLPHADRLSHGPLGKRAGGSRFHLRPDARVPAARPGGSCSRSVFPTWSRPPWWPATWAACARSSTPQGGDGVVKPLDGCGGQGVLRVRRGDPNLSSLLEIATNGGRVPVVAQAYLPAVREGDKRIILLGGEPLGAVLRVPREGELRANFASGGSAAPAPLTSRDREICRSLGPALNELGLWFVGIDVIGGKLTEVNVTSPTGLVEIDALSGESLEARVIDFALERAGLPARVAAGM